jgi:hypothetical protein
VADEEVAHDPESVGVRVAVHALALASRVPELAEVVQVPQELRAQRDLFVSR